MRVLHLAARYYPAVDGTTTVIQNVSEKLVSLFGDEVTVFTTTAVGQLADLQAERLKPGEVILNGVRVKRFSFFNAWAPYLEKAYRLSVRARLPFGDYIQALYKGPIAWDMIPEIARHQADVVFGSCFPYLHMYYADMLKCVHRMPVVYSGALHLADGPVSGLVLTTIRRASAYIAYTSYERDYLVRCGIDGAKIHVVGPGVDSAPFETADGRTFRARHGLNDVPVVAFIGRQASGKGIDTLLYAMRVVWETMPEARLVIAGSRFDFSDRLEEIVAEFEPQERQRIVFVNDFDEQEKAEIYAACDLLVAASRSESFGIVYLEAWASGKPVIGCRIGAVASVIEDGWDGLLVPYGDVGALAQAILRMLSDQALRVQMGDRGRRKVLPNYTWDNVALRFREVYRSVM